MRSFSRVIEGIPGLSDLLEQMTEALNVCEYFWLPIVIWLRGVTDRMEDVYTVLEPYLTPILKTATGTLGEGSRTVIDQDDQYQVFEDPRASDPSHSMLSKVNGYTSYLHISCAASRTTLIIS
jgi:Heterokaryon incompatibility protein Het-C